MDKTPLVTDIDNSLSDSSEFNSNSSGSYSFKPNNKMETINNQENEVKPSKTFLNVFFFVQGLVSLTSFFVFLSESDYFQN